MSMLLIARARLILLAIMLCTLAFGSTSSITSAQEVTPPPDAPTLSITFEELNDSGVTGVATLYGNGSTTIVQITVDGAGVEHPAHIHLGDCDDLDPYPAFPLENVVDGKSITEVDASLDELLTGGYAIDMHMAVNELGTLLVCAPIQGEATDGTGGNLPTEEPTEEPAATEEPEATEEATLEPTAEPTGVGGIGDGTNSGDGTGGANLPGDTTATLPLSGLNGNGITGIVSLVRINDQQTDITIQLSGDLVTGGHIAHLHLGTCDNLQDEGTIDLEPIDATGLSQTVVDVPFTTVLEGGYAINVHNSKADYENWLVCAEFADATLGDVVPEVGPDTGGGQPTPTSTAEADTLPEMVGTGWGLPAADSPISRWFWVFAVLSVATGLVAGAAHRNWGRMQ